MTSGYDASEVRFSHQDAELAGLLLTPSGQGPHPAVAFLHGSGPVDRDGPGYLPPIREHFARHGIAALCYTNRWTDLAGFAHKVQANLGQNTLALLDIDQTLWAPKGVHDSPLTRPRLRAISRLIDEYFAEPQGREPRSSRSSDGSERRNSCSACGTSISPPSFVPGGTAKPT